MTDWHLHDRDDTREDTRARGDDRHSDAEIRQCIEAHLRPGHYKGVIEITVEVNDGNVTLYGTVPHSVLRHSIQDMAASCPGVKHIDNKLTVPLTAPWPEQ